MARLTRVSIFDLIAFAMPAIVFSFRQMGGVGEEVQNSETKQDNLVEADDQHLKFFDIDSDMSRLLHQSGVIKEDVYNKPGDKYTLKIETGDYQRNPWIHGSFHFGGTYGGLLAGGSVGGVGGMLAGGAAGWQAGGRAAETLTRILQGQGSIVAKDDEANSNKLPQQTFARPHSPLVIQSGPTVPEKVMFSAIWELLGSGKSNENTINVPQDKRASEPRGFMQGMFEDALANSPNAVKETDKQVIDGLGSMLKSGSSTDREDAKLTLTLLDILRHRDVPVSIDVE